MCALARQLLKNLVSSPRKVNGVNRSVRARRFPLRLPVLFRTGEDEPWRRALSVGISETQLSFVSRRKLRVGDPLQMRFVVRVSSARSEVNCVGEVVRIQKAEPKSDAHTYTATIGRHQFVKLQ